MAGYYFDRVRVCCDEGAIPATPLEPIAWGERNSGVLLSKGDVVYFLLPAGVPSTERINLALWAGLGPDKSTQDIDIKVRCGAWPTETQFDYIAASSNPDEFLTIMNDTVCSAGWRIAVYQYGSVTGPFHLVASRIKQQRILSVRAGFEYSPTLTDKSVFASALTEAAKTYYAATEGQHLIQDIWVFGNAGSDCDGGCGGAPCDVCVKSLAWTGTSSSGVCGGKVRLNNTDKDSSFIIAHEWGHRYSGPHAP
jgi:hypothetical protein